MVSCLRALHSRETPTHLISVPQILRKIFEALVDILYKVMPFCSRPFTKNTHIYIPRLLASHNGFSRLCPFDRVSFGFHGRAFGFGFDLKVASKSDGGRHEFYSRRSIFQVDAMDEDSVGFNSVDWEESDGLIDYLYSSSDEDSDGDILLQPITDVDLPTTKDNFPLTDDTITLTAYRFAVLGKAQNRRKILYGVLNNIGLLTFLTLLLLLVDSCAWRIVRLPLEPFYLIRPFFISLLVVSFVGYICVPLFRTLKLHLIIKKGGPDLHIHKKGTPTMGGLYFIPVGIIVAEVLVGFSSSAVSGASAVTSAFASIGLLDDLLCFRNNKGLSARLRILSEVAVTIGFSFWLNATDISSPYNTKMVVPLPAPLGLICLGGFYPVFASFCFVFMANGVSLTDGLDGLAGGTAALAFVGMSIAVLPICSDLAVFGASMAGACVGFLFHNRYKASIFMGDTGSLALGGALAAMAACSGMFFPLFISSAVFVLEALSVIFQVSFYKTTKRILGSGSRLFLVTPFHHHLEMCGFKEPTIVAGAYAISCFLILCAGYVGLISA